jgi:hypothetical protein
MQLKSELVVVHEATHKRCLIQRREYHLLLFQVFLSTVTSPGNETPVETSMVAFIAARYLASDTQIANIRRLFK